MAEAQPPNQPLSPTAPSPVFLPPARAEREPETCAGDPSPDSPEQIVTWAAERYGRGLVMSTSFGIQSAALLHLATRIVPGIPVIWVDTGYLPPETYHYAEELSRRLGLDLRVYQSSLSAARMEALHGRLWESGDVADFDRYDRMRKVEPMRRALDELGAQAWLAGVRGDQTRHRSGLAVVGRQWGRAKIAPILGWSSRDLYGYLKRHELPQHPLFERGYASVGDWHSSRPLTEADGHERDTRFRGLKQECGLHLEEDEAASLEASEL